MKIAIIGGSIAGCFASILLTRKQHQVHIFERSTQTLVGRGGGIGTLSPLLNQLKAEDLIDQSFTALPIKDIPYVGKDVTSEPFGKVAWTMPSNFQVFHWNELWQQLRKRVDDHHYHAGQQIVDLLQLPNGKAKIKTAAGEWQEFDLLIFADGYNSIGRSLLFPESQLKYRGYVLWRGLLSEEEMPAAYTLEKKIMRISYKDSPGHHVVYLIPNPDSSVVKGKRVFNWAAYIPIEDLDDLMLGKDDKAYTGTIPPGKLRPEKEEELKSFLTREMPVYYKEMIQRTQNSYVQVIYTLDLPAYFKGNACLIGDAGAVVQPFTGSGVFKGYHNVKDLLNALDSFSSLDEALSKWSQDQVSQSRRLLALGEQMERALIWEQPDFAQMNATQAESWWRKAVQFPENFSHEKR